MKKVFIAAALLATSFFSVNAQDETPVAKGPILSKRGYPILPEAGDYSLSIGASGALGYFGNLFHNSPDNNNGNSVFSYPNQLGQTIMLRKFIDANTAYRAIVGINLASHSTKNLVNQDGVTTPPNAVPATVSDKRTTTSTLINIGAGLEKRRGTGRVQGVYGAQAVISYLGGGKTSYSYGNAFSPTITEPTSTSDFDLHTSSPSDSRIILSKQGSTFGLAVQAFGGVEYFIAPKISLGGEFSWGPSFTVSGQGKTETETVNGKKATATGGGSSIALGTGNMGGTLRLNFFF